MTPLYILLWVPLNHTWMALTVSVSVLMLSIILCLFNQFSTQEVLISTAAYDVILVNLLRNFQQKEIATGAGNLSAVRCQRLKEGPSRLIIE
jgi:hypothetical protein